MTDGRRAAEPRPRVLLVDGCESTRYRVAERLEQSGYLVTETKAAMVGATLRRTGPQLLVCRLESGDPARLLLEHSGLRPSQILTYTETARPSLVARAIRAGVECVFELPDQIDDLCESAERIAAHIAGTLDAQSLRKQLLGTGRSIARLREQVLALSHLDVPVLLSGEPGTGRKHVAHLLSGVRGKPLIIEPGAGLRKDHTRARLVLLQEVQAFSPEEQGQWLQKLRDASPGGSLRVLASASEELRVLSEAGQFDRALEQELSRFVLRLPPLRERREDIPGLAQRLCDASCRQLGRRGVKLTRSALTALQREAWPENLRGLRRIIEKAVAFSSSSSIGVREIRMLLEERAQSVDGLRSARERENRESLVRELRDAGGNLAEVGRRLGLSRGAVIYRAQKYGLLPEPRGRKRSTSRNGTTEAQG